MRARRATTCGRGRTRVIVRLRERGQGSPLGGRSHDELLGGACRSQAPRELTAPPDTGGGGPAGRCGTAWPEPRPAAPRERSLSSQPPPPTPPMPDGRDEDDDEGMCPASPDDGLASHPPCDEAGAGPGGLGGAGPGGRGGRRATRGSSQPGMLSLCFYLSCVSSVECRRGAAHPQGPKSACKPWGDSSQHPLWHGHHVLRTAGNQGGFAPMMGLQTGRLRR